MNESEEHGSIEDMLRKLRGQKEESMDNRTWKQRWFQCRAFIIPLGLMMFALALTFFVHWLTTQ